MTNLVIITAYCIGACCCGPYADGITASGKPAVVGVSAAANHLPFGTTVEIPGLGYRQIQDRMAKRFTGRIDVLMGSHSEALRWGRKALEVKIVFPDKNADRDQEVRPALRRSSLRHRLLTQFNTQFKEAQSIKNPVLSDRVDE